MISVAFLSRPDKLHDNRNSLECMIVCFVEEYCHVLFLFGNCL